MSIRQLNMHALDKTNTGATIDRMTQAVIYDSERTYRELRAVEVELTFPVRKVSPVKIDKFISVPSFIIDDLTAYKARWFWLPIPRGVFAQT